MTATQLEKFRRLSYGFALKIVKRPELAEEISQDVLLSILEKNHASPHIKYLTIDAVRRRFGSPGSNRNERGGFELFDSYGTEGEHAREIEGYSSQDKTLTGTHALDRVELDRFKSYLSPKQIKLFEALRSGYKIADYADKVGTTSASVYQMLERAKKNIHAKKVYIKPPKSRRHRNKPRRGKFVLKTDETLTITLGKNLADVERDYILAVLKACKDNRTHASEVLGISLRGLRYKLGMYGINEPEKSTTRGRGYVKQKNLEHIVSLVLKELKTLHPQTNG